MLFKHCVLITTAGNRWQARVTNIRTILRTLDKGACIVLTHSDSSPARLPCTLKAARNFFKVDLNCFITRNFEIEENNKLKGQLFLFLETLPK